MAVLTHESCKLRIEPGHNDHGTTDIVFRPSNEDKYAKNQAPKLVWLLFLVMDNLIKVM